MIAIAINLGGILRLFRTSTSPIFHQLFATIKGFFKKIDVMEDEESLPETDWKEVKKCSSTEKKRKRSENGDNDMRTRLDKLLIMSQLAHLIMRMRIGSSLRLQGLMLSLLPYSMRSLNDNSNNYIISLLEWFRSVFFTCDWVCDTCTFRNFSSQSNCEVCGTKREIDMKVAEESIERVVKIKHGSIDQLLLLFLCLLRALEINCRLVRVLETNSSYIGDDTYIKDIMRGTLKTINIDESNNTDDGLGSWLEVFIDGNWLCIDFQFQTTIMKPIELLNARVKYYGISGNIKIASVFTYIISIDFNFNITDVTRKYAGDNWNNYVKMRLPLIKLYRKPREENKLSWWEQIMNQFGDIEGEVEEKIIRQSKIPTTLEGLRREGYVLERFLTRYQIIYPLKPVVGIYGGKENIYPPECLCTVHSKIKWKYLGRVVRDNELNNPAKTIIKVIRNKFEENKDKDLFEWEEENNNEEMISLYGKWQTEPVVPVVIGEDGIIPTNDYGNIELWCKEYLPVGAVHVTNKFALTAAKNLRIPFARAVVGLDFKKGKPTAKYLGIVISERFVELLENSCNALSEEYEKKEREAKKELIWRRWKTLISRIIVRKALEGDFAPENNVEQDIIKDDRNKIDLPEIESPNTPKDVIHVISPDVDAPILDMNGMPISSNGLLVFSSDEEDI